VFKVTVSRTVEEVLAECLRRGLVVRLDTIVRTPPGGRHWHLGFPGIPGVLEVTDTGVEVSLKVASNRDGGWATDLARTIATGTDEPPPVAPTPTP
jgi:hypothetical protein